MPVRVVPARSNDIRSIPADSTCGNNVHSHSFANYSNLDSSSSYTTATATNPLGSSSESPFIVSQSAESAEPETKRWPVLLSFIIPALGGLLFGYDIGATSFVVVQLESSSYSGVDWYSTVADSAVWRGIITSGSVGGAFLISFLVFPLSEVLGRRGEMLIGASLYMLGGLLQVMAGISSLAETAALSLLVCGRLVFGMGIGFSMHAVPIYISETMPSAVRGAFISAKEAVIVGGMVRSHIDITCTWDWLARDNHHI